jgi:hypothetical protein
MVVLLYSVDWLPMLELVLLTIVVQIVATVWNAGWRAGEDVPKVAATVEE